MSSISSSEERSAALCGEFSADVLLCISSELCVIHLVGTGFTSAPSKDSLPGSVFSNSSEGLSLSAELSNVDAWDLCG